MKVANARCHDVSRIGKSVYYQQSGRTVASREFRTEAQS